MRICYALSLRIAQIIVPVVSNPAWPIFTSQIKRLEDRNGLGMAKKAFTPKQFMTYSHYRRLV